MCTLPLIRALVKSVKIATDMDNRSGRSWRRSVRNRPFVSSKGKSSKQSSSRLARRKRRLRAGFSSASVL